ncbi:hypothetical protein [Actinomadura sp. 21ATH]|uniref:hypothetical protein n=1 Tax=Actinomadura sp. 21ATH TaxID=1735444 RepID=UPI0035BFD928
MTGRTRHLAAALTGLGLGLAVLGPGLAPGFVLSYDMVFVPDPAFTRLTFGLTGTVPRHVPSDAFVTALAVLAPAWLVQRLVLLSIFVMACASAASLVPSRRVLPRLVAGVAYAWNPFVAERLLLGQWALLLGYAALPWALAAAVTTDRRGGGRRLLCALIPAAIGGFAALAVSGLAAFAAGRRRFKVLAVLAVLSLPWLVPSLLRPDGVPGDGLGVETFAARADTPFGTLGSLLLLGGVWNGETVPLGYGAPVTATLWALVVLGALAAYTWHIRRPGVPGGTGVPGALNASRDAAASGHAAGVSSGFWGRVAVAAGAGFGVAAVGAVVPGLLEGAISLWSGFAVFRDGQQFAAPLAAVVAAGLGIAAEKALRARYAAVAYGALLAPVVLLPSLAWGAAGQLRPVEYPDDWARARDVVAADRAPGDVLVLPWAAYRSYAWNHGRRVLDPLPRYLSDRRVVVNDAVMVGGETVAPEDPRAVWLDAAIRSGGPLTEVLGKHGIRYVAVDAADPSAGPERLPGAERVVRGPDLVLYRIPVTVTVAEENAPVAATALAWIVVSVAIFWSLSGYFVTSATTLGLPLLGSIPRRRAP